MANTKKIIICPECGKEGRSYGGICQTCYNYYKTGGTNNAKPKNGEITYDVRGYPICHICGRAYRKVLYHVNQSHGITEKEYKAKYDLESSKGIIAKETREKLQKSVADNYNLVVTQNLVNNPKSHGTRFKIGSKGRTRDKVTLQTRTKLSDRLKRENYFKDIKNIKKKVKKNEIN